MPNTAKAITRNVRIITVKLGRRHFATVLSADMIRAFGNMPGTTEMAATGTMVTTDEMTATTDVTMAPMAATATRNLAVVTSKG